MRQVSANALREHAASANSSSDMILVRERRSGVLGIARYGTSNAQRGILTVDTGKWAGVIWSGERCERVRLPDNEQGRFREFWPELSYLAYWLIAVRSPRSLSLR